MAPMSLPAAMQCKTSPPAQTAGRNSVASSSPRALHGRTRRLRPLLLACIAGMTVAGCGPPATPTYFIAPTMAAVASVPQPNALVVSSTSTPQVVAVPTLTLPSPTPPCIDGLTYLQDLTIPDGSIMAPGQSIDKRWQVSNSGTCNWDARYRLKLLSGDSMGAGISVPLYPARAGTQVTLSILFTAPQVAGTYECQWQAVNPDSLPFGDAFYMQIVVSP